MPRVSPDYLDQRREQILDAALACSSRDGFSDTTIEAIAREAGISHGAIYLYFKSKDDIIRALAGRDGLVRTQRFSNGHNERAPERLADAIRNAQNLQSSPLAESRRRVHAQLLAEGVRNPEFNVLIVDTWNDIGVSLSNIVRQGQADGDMDQGLDPEGVAQIIGAIHTGLVMRMANEPDLDIKPGITALHALLSARSQSPQFES
jgi:AcrR family transcriptional regulator